jgi:hypothetical protein
MYKVKWLQNLSFALNFLLPECMPRTEVLQEASPPPRLRSPEARSERVHPGSSLGSALQNSEARFGANLDASWSFGSSTLQNFEARFLGRFLSASVRFLGRFLSASIHFLGSFRGSVCFAIHQANLSHDQVCRFKSANHLGGV